MYEREFFWLEGVGGCLGNPEGPPNPYKYRGWEAIPCRVSLRAEILRGKSDR